MTVFGLENLSPTQRKLLLYGSIAVGVLVAGRRLFSGGPAPDTAGDGAAGDGTTPAPVGGTIGPDAGQPVLGTDALAAYQSSISGILADILARLQATGTNTPTTPSANIRSESRARLWLYLYWLYQDATPPAGQASPYTADQLLAELYRRRVNKVNKHAASKAGRAYRVFVEDREAAPAAAPVASAPAGPVALEQQAPAPAASPATRPPASSSSSSSSGRREPAPAPRRPTTPAAPPPVTATPDAGFVSPAQRGAGAAAYGPTRRQAASRGVAPTTVRRSGNG